MPVRHYQHTRTSYYDILGIAPDVDDKTVKQAYRALVKKHHPDLNPYHRKIAELRLKLINEAYAHLKTGEKRLSYNKSLRAENDNRAAGSWFLNWKGFFK